MSCRSMRSSLSDGDIEDEAVPLDRVMKSVEGVKRLKLVILDACRDNPFIASMRRSSGSARSAWGSRRWSHRQRHADRLRREGGHDRGGRRRPEQPVHVSAGSNMSRSRLDIRIALGKVRDDVICRRPEAGRSRSLRSLGGDLLSLVPPPQAATAQAPATSADRCSAAALHWTEISKLNRLNLYQEHLALFPDCAFAGLARIKVEELSKSASLPDRAAGSRCRQRRSSAAAIGDCRSKSSLNSGAWVACREATREWDPRAKAAVRSFNHIPLQRSIPTSRQTRC